MKIQTSSARCKLLALRNTRRSSPLVFITQLMGMKRDFIETLLNRDKYDVGIICALSEEFEQMQKAFDGCQWEDCHLSGLPFLFRTTTVPTINLHDVKVIAVCADRPGVCATSILATAMYTVARVDALFMTGITVGVNDGTIKLNDVIIADSVGDYATGKLEDNEDGDISWLREIHEASASTRLLSAASSVARDEAICGDINKDLLQQNLITADTNVKFQIAKTVCGPFVMASSALIDVLKSSDRKLDSTSLPIALRNRPCGLRQSVTLQIGIRGMATIRVAPMQVLHSCIKC